MAGSSIVQNTYMQGLKYVFVAIYFLASFYTPMGSSSRNRQESERGSAFERRGRPAAELASS